MTGSDISIRSIQHYLYCPHRWGLLEIDCAWAENYFVTKANILHKRVHETGMYTSRGKKSYTSVTVYNDLPQYGIYGITDCIEFNKDGCTIIEYKPTKPETAEYNHDDLMQVFAQKLCVDYVFGGDCEGCLYYGNVKKRIVLPLKENFEQYNTELLSILSDIRDRRARGIIPPVKKGQKCSGCSMKDICMPNSKRQKGLHELIGDILEEQL